LIPEGALTYAVATTMASVKALVLAGFGVGDLPTFALSAREARRLVRARVAHDPRCAIFLAVGAHWRGPSGTRTENALVGALTAALARLEPAPREGSTRRMHRGHPRRA